MRYVGLLWLIAVAVFAVMPGAALASSCSHIAVGAVLSLTGKNSAAGALTRNGYEFAVQQLREAGGIRIGDRCYNFRIVYRDDESSPARGVLVTRRLIREDRIPFLLGSNSAPVTEAISDIAESTRTPMLVAHGMPKAFFAKGRRFLFGLLSPSQQDLSAGLDFAANMARAADRTKSNVKLALISSDDPYMADLNSTLRRHAGARRLEVVVDEKPAKDLVDLPNILAKVRQTNADVLMVTGHARTTARIAEELKDTLQDKPIIAMTECETARVATRAAKIAGRILCAARASASPIGETSVWRSRAVFDRVFRSRFPDFGNRAVPDAAAQAALAVHVLADALRRTGTRDPDRVHPVLHATDILTFFGRITFPGKRKATVAPMVWRQLQGGQYRVVAPANLATHKYLSPRSGL